MLRRKATNLSRNVFPFPNLLVVKTCRPAAFILQCNMQMPSIMAALVVKPFSLGENHESQ